MVRTKRSAKKVTPPAGIYYDQNKFKNLIKFNKIREFSQNRHQILCSHIISEPTNPVTPDCERDVIGSSSKDKKKQENDMQLRRLNFTNLIQSA